MNEQQVLVVAGDYDIVMKVQHALKNKGFNVYSAYSHRDATYAAKHVKHDIALVDVGMVDRVSGAQTLAAISVGKHPPVVAIAVNGDSVGQAPVERVVTTLDDASIQKVIVEVLRLPELRTKPLAIDDTIIDRDENQQRVAEIQALFALSRSLTEVLNLSEVLNRVVEAARHLTNAEEGMILLPDEVEPGQLVLRAKVGIDSDAARNFSIKTQDTLAGAVFDSSEPLRIAEQGPQKVKTEYFVNALLYVPILLKGKSIGVLGVNNKLKHNVFTTRHQELLSSLASYAAIAIENARIHEESVKRARELKALVDASEVINSSVSLDRTLPNICEQLAQVLGVNRADIFQWNAKDNQLETLARYQHTAWRRGLGTLIPLDKRPQLRAALQSGKPMLLSRNDARLTEEIPALERAGIAALLVLPLAGPHEPIGTALAGYVRPPPQPPDDKALERARVVAREALVPLMERAGAANADASLALARSACELLKADWCELTEYSARDQTLNARLVSGGGVWLSAPYPCLDLAPFADLRSALETLAPISAVRDGETPASLRALLDYSRSRAVLGVPFVSRGQVGGLVLFADADRAVPFTTREIDLARAVVAQAATALDNAHLFHDLEVSLKELRETQDRLVQTARLSAMGEMAAAVAHQINNPLTTIVLDTELMLVDEPADSTRREALSAIMRSGKRAAGVVRRLLATARMPSADATMEPINIVTTVVEIVDLVKAHIERDRVALTMKVPTDPIPPVLAVIGELDDVWLNLLLNGRDALQGREDAKLNIEVSYDDLDEKVDVVVWDNGPGIPQGLIAEVFKPFFTTKPVGQGTGLGLHICRQVVERVGGTISVSNQSNAGARFVVRLPIERGG